MSESNKNSTKNECLQQIKLSWQSFRITIVAFVILAALFIIPLNCSSQSSCNCCRTDSTVVNPTVTVQLDVDVLKLLEGIRCDSIVMKQDIIISPETITIQQHSKLWPSVIFRIAFAIILLLALLFTLKYLVPYWTRIAELKDKEKERQMKYDEEQREYDRLQKRTDISIQDRKARADIDENAKVADHNRKIEIMRQEYQTHLADVALEMFKVANSSNDQESINQIIQQLIMQNNE